MGVGFYVDVNAIVEKMWAGTMYFIQIKGLDENYATNRETITVS